MNTKNLVVSSIIIGILLMFTGCKKDKDDAGGGQSKRMVKYEITGTYTGKLLVAYTTPSGGVASATINSLPWIKEIAYNNTIAGIGIGGDTDLPNFGIPGQTVTVKIFSGGTTVVNGTPAVVNANGIVNLPNLTYLF